jgi:hypothetical protein
VEVEISFPEKAAIQSKTFAPMGLLIEDLDGNGTPEAYLTATHNPYFPSVVLQFNALTGERLQKYVHAGHLVTQPRAINLDRSGDVKELLLGGTSNAYGQAVLVVLDPRTMEGHGPVTSEYRLAGVGRAAERAYFRFPYTSVGRVRQTTHPLVRKIIRRRTSRRIQVEVFDGSYGADRTVDRPYVVTYFNYDLRPLAVGTSSEYDHLADSLAKSRLIEAPPDSEDLAAYRNQIQYWTGSGWTMKPTMNDQWREALHSDTTTASPSPSRQK